MAIEKKTIELLTEYWQSQGVIIEPTNYTTHFILPKDFVDFYKLTNGMGNLYPNYLDKNGFLFYPLEKILTVEFQFSSIYMRSNIFIFAEYMHSSWWYGVEVFDSETYNIVIISDEQSFKYLTSSLNEFLLLYLSNADKLYEY